MYNKQTNPADKAALAPSPGAKGMLADLWRQRKLLMVLARREIAARYRGSMMGFAWSFVTPLLMLAIYTFVFSVVFQTRWGQDVSSSRADFAILMFTGMVIHGLMAECINRAPDLITSNPSYVKKIVFPLEILPLVCFVSAFFNTITSTLILLLAVLVFRHELHPTLLLFPLVLLPLALGTLGLAWFLASLGVFVRDIGQLTGLFTTVLLFMSGVFFPISALSERLQFWMNFNPLAVVIEQSRQVLIFGQLPDPLMWLALMVFGSLLALLGYAWFQKTRKGFADVL